MKRFTRILIFLFFLAALNTCGKDENTEPEPVWEKISVFSPEPYMSLIDVQFCNNNFGVICGFSGVILKTVNGGEDWQTIILGNNPSLLCLFVLNENEFYTASHGLWKTSNGGNSFAEIIDQNSPGPSIFGIHFFDSSNGLIINGSTILKTTDGGKSWAEDYNIGDCRKMQFVSDSIGYVYGGLSFEGVCHGDLLKTYDGADSWTDLKTDSEVYNWEILAMSFINKDTGYLANSNREIYRTLDGGITWEMRCEKTPSYIGGMVFLSENEGYALSYLGIHKTIDGGVNWSLDYENASNSLTSITKTPDNKTIIAVGGNSTVMIKKYH